MKKIIFFFSYLISIIFGIADLQTTNLSQSELCRLRCVALCLSTSSLNSTSNDFTTCGDKCVSFGMSSLCSNDECWATCKDLPAVFNVEFNSTAVGPTDNISYDYNSKYELQITWDKVPDADIYQVIRDCPDGMTEYQTATNSVSNITLNVATFCQECSIIVTPVSGIHGVGRTSDPGFLDPPRPLILPNLTLNSLVYKAKPYEFQNYKSNGTIIITLKYNPSKWPLGDADLDIVPMFHMIMCAEPDLTQAVPLPTFTKGQKPNTLVGQVGADMMYRKCRFVYSIQEVHSMKCQISQFVHVKTEDFGDVDINCATVQNNDCNVVQTYRAPVCGQINQFHFDIIDPHRIDWGRRNSNISVNVSFVPYSYGLNVLRPQYYVALYGDAEPYGSKEEENLLGVNMTNTLGRASNCLRFASNHSCLETINSSIIITNLKMDKLYGIMLCAVMDPRNLAFPSVNISSRAIKTKANKLLINAKDFRKSKTGLILGIIFAIVGIIVLSSCVAFVYYYRNLKRKRQLDKFKIQSMEREIAQRYTEFPKKNDLWELERRNLIIYDDKKLGSGAFGYVFLAKLIGKAEGSKDAQSTLGVNIMRAENCLVAVKMLPEYADELSKSEFLKEIALMKTLGYHERLVNMLACVTDSEPYCLVVEYCSDGDLLHFLRERCKYMLKLDEQNVDYGNPDCNVEFDTNMIMTVKQLLMFSVQISFGLEYLSQKGFVHRDVAARNVLVHDGNYAKIGDFGLCRYIYAESSNYKSKGGRLPIKWMSPEAIRHYEFTTKSDVWSFGILMFEIITLGGTPYPGIQPDDMLPFLEAGNRMPQPDNCPNDYHTVMKSCWTTNPKDRPDFSTIRQMLAIQLEEVSDEYSYLKLDAQKDYYNVAYNDKCHTTETAISLLDTVQILSDTTNENIAKNQSVSPSVVFKHPALENSNSGVSIDLNSDQFLLPLRNSPSPRGRENLAFAKSSNDISTSKV